MSPVVRFVSLHPDWLLALSVVGLCGWVTCDAVLPTTPAAGRSQPGPPAPVPLPAPRLPPPPFGTPGPALLADLELGMPRGAVERHLGPLPPYIDPVCHVAHDRVSRVRYRVHLSEPLPHGPFAEPFAPGPYHVTLEFDGDDPEQPLSGILVTPAPGE